MTAAAVAVSSFAAFAVTANADGDATATDTYREWLIINTTSPDVAKSPTMKSNGSLTTDAKLTIGNNTVTKNVKDLSGSFNGYGSSYTMNTDTKYMFIGASSTIDITLNTNLSSNTNYESYELMLIYGHKPNDKGDVDKLRIYKSDGSTKLVDATTAATSITPIITYTETFTEDTIKIGKNSGEARLFYIGIKYNAKESSGDDPIEEPTPEPTQKALTVGTTISASEPTMTAVPNNKTGLIGEYILAYSGVSTDISGGKNRIKLNGTAKVTDYIPSSKAISIIPAAAGTLVVDFAHASSNGTDERALIATQSGKELGRLALNQGGAQGTLSVNVSAGESVYLYSSNSGLNIYSITLKENKTTQAGYKFTSTLAQAMEQSLVVNATIDGVDKTSEPIALSEKINIDGDGSAIFSVLFTNIREGVTINSVTLK